MFFVKVRLVVLLQDYSLCYSAIKFHVFILDLPVDGGLKKRQVVNSANVFARTCVINANGRSILEQTLVKSYLRASVTEMPVLYSKITHLAL